MKVSVIVSSYNQCIRLRHCLDSAVRMKCKFAEELEIIVADDNSTDGSIDLIKQYPVKLWLNQRGNSNKYTLAANWNDAIDNLATGDRILFTNGDHILTTWFADHHADPVMKENIVFGPAYQTSSQTIRDIERHDIGYKELVYIFEENQYIQPDRHVEGSAMTYNHKWTSDFPYGYNFSVMKKHFDSVNGFTEFDSWGGEEKDLCDRIISKNVDVDIVSNCNSVAIHLFHPPVNLINRRSGDLENYNF